MTLEKKLTDMEKRNSMFETTLRREPLPICSAFIKNGKVVPVTFTPTDQVLHNKPEDRSAIEANFKNTLALNQNTIMEAEGTPLAISGKRICVLFSGGPAAGGHNVLAGIWTALGNTNTLLGVRQGPRGLLKGDLFPVTQADIQSITNMGGFDFLGSDRTKIKTKEQFEQVRQVVHTHHLNAIIIIGGDDSNTNAAVLAEFLSNDDCAVIGVPKTIDGDLQVSNLLPISFGFDTATKIYAEMVGNILQDTPSSMKYWHFVKLMGRSASQVALEVALQTRANLALISEEVLAEKLSLGQVVQQIADTIAYRAARNLHYGLVLIPEGLIEFIPEIKGLIDQLNDIVAKLGADLTHQTGAQKIGVISEMLSEDYRRLFHSLPAFIQDQLVQDRDSHGNLKVSQIPTELLLIEMTESRIKAMQNDSKLIAHLNFSPEEEAKFKAYKFASNNHFFGYEGRCGAPSRFDAAFTYNLGLIAGSLALDGKTGYMAALTDLDRVTSRALAIPLTGLINVERRHGHDELVIEKALVKLDSPAFHYFKNRRGDWAKEDLFSSPGPRQYFGPTANQLPLMIALNQHYSDINFTIGPVI